MDRAEMYERTKQFAIRVIKLVDAMPNKTSTQVVSKQLLRSATSVGANFREACKGKSRADFLSKIKICESEAEESCFWLELILESGLMSQTALSLLMDESRQLCAIFSAMVKTPKQTRARTRSVPNFPNRES